MPASASAHSKPLEAAPRFGEPAPPKASASTRRASWFTKASDSSIHVVVESLLALDCGVESRLELAGLASLASERARAASSEPRGPQRPAHGRRLCQSAIERQVLFRRVEAPCAFGGWVIRTAAIDHGLDRAPRAVPRAARRHSTMKNGSSFTLPKRPFTPQRPH